MLKRNISIISIIIVSFLLLNILLHTEPKESTNKNIFNKEAYEKLIYAPTPKDARPEISSIDNINNIPYMDFINMIPGNLEKVTSLAISMIHMENIGNVYYNDTSLCSPCYIKSLLQKDYKYKTYDAINILSETGCMPLDLMPLTERGCVNSTIPSGYEQRIEKFKAKIFALINVYGELSENNIKNTFEEWLFNKKYIVVSMLVNDEWKDYIKDDYTLTENEAEKILESYAVANETLLMIKDRIRNTIDDSSIKGYSLILGGYNSKERYFQAVTGTKWGENDYFKLSYEAAKLLIMEAYGIIPKDKATTSDIRMNVNVKNRYIKGSRGYTPININYDRKRDVYKLDYAIMDGTRIQFYLESYYDKYNINIFNATEDNTKQIFSTPTEDYDMLSPDIPITLMSRKTGFLIKGDDETTELFILLLSKNDIEGELLKSENITIDNIESVTKKEIVDNLFTNEVINNYNSNNSLIYIYQYKIREIE